MAEELLITEQRDYLDKIPSRDYVIQKQAYWDLVAWISSPIPAREPKTQKELAEKLGMSEQHLSVWKKVDGFKDDVLAIVRQGARDRVGTIIAALEKGIYTRGQGSDVEKWFKLALGEDVGDGEKHLHIHTELTPERQKLIEEYEAKLKIMKTQ